MCKLKVSCVVILAIWTVSLFSAIVGTASSVHAVDQPSGQGSSDSCQEDSNFLFLPKWYRGLCESGSVSLQGKNPGVVVLTILLNVVDIVLRILTFVAIAYTIFGGFLYLTARGDPGKIVKARLAVTQALVGLIIGVASSAIVGFVVGGMA